MSQYLQQQPIKEYNNTTMSRAVAFSFLISNGESITLASEIIRQISSKLADGSSLETLVTSCTEVNANYLQLICYLNALTHQKLDPVKIKIHELLQLDMRTKQILYPLSSTHVTYPTPKEVCGIQTSYIDAKHVLSLNSPCFVSHYGLSLDPCNIKKSSTINGHIARMKRLTLSSSSLSLL